jgi:hypothetical protein
MQAYTDYSPGSVTTRTAGAARGPDPLDAMIEERLRELRTARSTPVRSPGIGGVKLGRAESRGMPLTMAPAREGVGADDAAMRRAAVRSAQAKAEIDTIAAKPLPRRNIGGVGVVPGHVADMRFLPHALLPSKGEIATSPENVAAAQRAAAQQAAWDDLMQQARARTATQGQGA